MTAATFPVGLNPNIKALLQALFVGMGQTPAIPTPNFELKLTSTDGQKLWCSLIPKDGGATLIESLLDPSTFTEPSGGAATLDGSYGSSTLVASTKTLTVPAPASGEKAVPVGSIVLATVVTPGGTVKQLSAVRASDTTITVSSPGSGYGALLASAGVNSTLVAGAKDIALANIAGDQLAVILKTAHGTPGVLSIVRKDNATVTVQSWLAATGIQALDISDVTVFNFGQAADETSTFNWVVIRP